MVFDSKTPPGISVIICCYNSAQRLPETLKHLAEQQVADNILWEVIVIDNASTDDTALIARAEWDKHQTPITLHVLKEPVPGKNHAFKTGIDKAAYQYILTCDDDNWLQPDYIGLAFNIMAGNKMIGALGGCGILAPDEPAWPDVYQYASTYVTGPQPYASINKWVYGAGCVYNKLIIEELYQAGWRPITTGRTRTKLICGEDVEHCFAIYLKGYKIIADGRLKFFHQVPVSRQNKEYIIRMEFWTSYSYVLLTNYLMLLDNDKRTVKKHLNALFTLTFKASLLLLAKIFKSDLIKFRAIAPEHRSQLIGYTGKLMAILQNKRKLINYMPQLLSTLDFANAESTL